MAIAIVDPRLRRSRTLVVERAAAYARDAFPLVSRPHDHLREVEGRSHPLRVGLSGVAGGRAGQGRTAVCVALANPLAGVSTEL